MVVTWRNLVELALDLCLAKVETVCNSPGGYSVRSPKMEVLVEIDGCTPPEQIIVDKIGVYQTSNYVQVQKMLYEIYADNANRYGYSRVPYASIQLIRDFPSNEGLVF